MYSKRKDYISFGHSESNRVNVVGPEPTDEVSKNKAPDKEKK